MDIQSTQSKSKNQSFEDVESPNKKLIKPPPKTDNQELEQSLQDSVVEIKFLARTWLDDFEKDIFDGKTINELLNQTSYE